MTTALEQIRNKLKFKIETLSGNEEEVGSKENFNKSYKLDDGKNKYRLVAYEDGSIVKKLPVHMNLGVPFLCPKKLHNEYCPSCDFGWAEYKRNGNKHTQDELGRDISKAYLSQDKFIFRGIFRSKEESDFKEFGHPMLRWYDASPTLAKEILKYCSDVAEYGDVTDLIDGIDLILTRDPEKAKNRQQSVTADLARKNSPVLSLNVDDPNFVSCLESMLAKAPKLEDRFFVKNADEISQLMKDALLREKTKQKAETEDFGETSSNFKDAFASLEDDLEVKF